ncbi:unnamed protein product [Paramecium sonneborni]|uniref:Uncharacterized protein n=1 Tax=Paramecium sonneborni TaxID=65129 RepID=A0A8S1M6C0_9CILI|nr:unnamed protein product [Paramecium sonneborni]
MKLLQLNYKNYLNNQKNIEQSQIALIQKLLPKLSVAKIMASLNQSIQSLDQSILINFRLQLLRKQGITRMIISNSQEQKHPIRKIYYLQVEILKHFNQKLIFYLKIANYVITYHIF